MSPVPVDQSSRMPLGRGGAPTLLLGACFALAVATFWILKPLKKTLLLSHFGRAQVVVFGSPLSSAQVELCAKSITIGCAGAFSLLFLLLSRKLSGRLLPLGFSLVFALVFFGFSLVDVTEHGALVSLFTRAQTSSSR